METRKLTYLFTNKFVFVVSKKIAVWLLRWLTCVVFCSDFCVFVDFFTQRYSLYCSHFVLVWNSLCSCSLNARLNRQPTGGSSLVWRGTSLNNLRVTGRLGVSDRVRDRDKLIFPLSLGSRLFLIVLICLIFCYIVLIRVNVSVPSGAFLSLADILLFLFLFVLLVFSMSMLK